MATTKKTTAKTTVKDETATMAAAAKAAAEAAKTAKAEPKAEVEVEEKKAPAKKAAPVKEEKPVVEEKAPAKKAAAKKAPAKKAAPKKVAPKKPAEVAAKTAPVAETKVNFFVEFGNAQVSIDEVIKNIKATYGKDAKEISVYLKPEESKAYFVADGETMDMDVYFC